jgi:L-threonylcarbamoyladenylate synthase
VIAEHVPDELDARVEVVGHPADVDAYAHSLYRFLRDADARTLDVVLVVPPPAIGLGAAVVDRLRRAAGAG